jgi:hypothetical protein
MPSAGPLPGDRPATEEAAMTLHSTCDAPVEVPAPPEATVADAHPDTDAADGWDSLALAELRRPLTPAEHALNRSLPVEEVLDRLFPELSDAARHEALWALG